MSVKFKFIPNIEDGFLRPAQIGTVLAPLVTADIHKAVMYGPNDNVLLCGDGDEISSFLVTVDTSLSQDGFKLGDIQDVEVGSRRRVRTSGATVVAGTTLVVGAAQSASGIADAYATVRAGTPLIYRWIVRSIISGGGTAGSIVVIERV